VTRKLTIAAAALSALALACVAGAPPAQSKTPSAGKLRSPTLLTAEAGGSGSTVGPDGDLYVTDSGEGRVLRVDPTTGAVTTYTSGLPKSILGFGGAVDVAFLGRTAYVLVTLVGPDVGGSDVVGVYRVDGPTRSTVVADIGAFALSNPPDTDFFVPSGVQYALEPFHGRLLVTDGHHNRLLLVELDGAVSELRAFGNIVPTGLATRGKTIYMAQAGPVPHLPEDGRIVRISPGSSVAEEVASGGRLLVDVELARSRSVFALAQGIFPAGAPEGSPALPDTGQLLKANREGTFDVVVDGLDRPTSLEIVGKTAYVVTFDGEIWKVDGLGRPGRGAVVLPPTKRVEGRSLAEWQRAFFEWSSLIPTDGPQPHPGLTQGDVDCSYAQRGHVWFLELGGVERRCSIPFGKTLYVPVNFWACLPEADLIPFPQCEADGDAFLAAATFTLTLDGRRIDLRAWRTETGRFRLELADQNVWEAFFGFDDLGRSTRFSADGVGALVQLGPGRHTVVAGLAVDADGDGTPEHTSETSYEIRVTHGRAHDED
jgi:hypothetical protein